MLVRELFPLLFCIFFFSFLESTGEVCELVVRGPSLLCSCEHGSMPSPGYDRVKGFMKSLVCSCGEREILFTKKAGCVGQKRCPLTLGSMSMNIYMFSVVKRSMCVGPV